MKYINKTQWVNDIYHLFSFIFILIALMCSPNNAHASSFTIPVPNICEEGVGWVKSFVGHAYCFPTPEYVNDGINILKSDTSWGSQPLFMEAQFSGFVPKTGFYYLRFHACPTTVANRCSIANSTIVLRSQYNIYILSNQNFMDGDRNFGPFSANIPANSSICFTLVDSNEIEWGLPGKFTCSDAGILPDKPSSCNFNSGAALNVDMGTIERSTIGIAPGTTPTVKKTLQVVCTGDAAITSNIQFQYTPLSVNGSSVVQSSANGLGVAIIYKGSAVKPTDVFTQSYESGITPLDLEFEAVRDPKVASGAIPTGKFSANAVMVVTQQ